MYKYFGGEGFPEWGSLWVKFISDYKDNFHACVYVIVCA